MKITRIIDKVLIVDDDPISNHLSVEILKKAGFAEQIIIKENGKKAIDYLQFDCNLDDTCPSLILLDIKMPVANGFDFLKEFNSLRIKKHIVIVILTGSNNGEDIIKLRSLGRYQILSKPLTLDKTVDIHHKYFRSHVR